MPRQQLSYHVYVHALYTRSILRVNPAVIMYVLPNSRRSYCRVIRSVNPIGAIRSLRGARLNSIFLLALHQTLVLAYCWQISTVFCTARVLIYRATHHMLVQSLYIVYWLSKSLVRRYFTNIHSVHVV